MRSRLQVILTRVLVRHCRFFSKKMLRFGTILAVAIALAEAAPNPNNIIELDLSPEDAQKYISNPPYTEPKLVQKTAVLPLVKYNDPRFRTADAGPTLGHYWKNGHEIENPDDYVEEVYDANQFHGQDGLGAYAYGYETPESAKVENRVRSGDVTGSYTFKSGDNDIKVRYWADSDGFHQEDNIPKVELKPVEESEDVREARLAHEKAWKEAAEAGSKQPQLPPGYWSGNPSYPQTAAQQQQYIGSANQVQPAYVPAPSGPLPSYFGSSNAPQYVGAASNYQPSYAAAPNVQTYQTAASESQPAYLAAPSEVQSVSQREGKAYYGQSQQYPEKLEEPEPTGPPRGFFYKFDYPVSIIVPKNQQGVNPGYPVDKDTVALNYQRS